MRNQGRAQARTAVGLLAAMVVAVGLTGCPHAGKGSTGTPSQPGTSQELVIGFIGPLSGDAASFGLSQKNGIELAVSEVNAGGGIAGRKVRLVSEDSQLDQNRAIAAFNKLVDIDKAQVILGETSSANTLAIGPLAARKGVLLISPIASAAGVTKAGFRIFRISPSDDFQAKIAAQFARGKGWEQAAVLYTNDDWGGGLKDGFAADFGSLGGKVVAAEGVKPQTQDLRTQLTRIKALKPDFVYVPLHPDEAVVALRQAKQLGFATQFLGADSFSEATIRQAAGDAANGVIYTVPAAGSGEARQRFAGAYERNHGEEPNVNAANAYDAVMVLAQAGQTAGSADVAALTQALAQTKDFAGASGLITFDANGDVTSKTYDIMSIEGGKPKVLQPGVAAEG